jgi:FixJ family two-component response regulator
VPVIVLTPLAPFVAVDAMKAGANDFLVAVFHQAPMTLQRHLIRLPPEQTVPATAAISIAAKSLP